MKLVFLGTTGYHPNERRHTACLMLPELGVVLDAGSGIFRARQWLQTSELDIFITHAHLDHVMGLTFLFDVFAGRKMDRVTVHGEAAKLQALDEHLFTDAIFPVRPPFQWQPIGPITPLQAGGQLTFFPLDHPGGSIGFRLDFPGRSLAYVTDTTARVDAPYLDAIRGVDVLVHECYFGDGNEEWAQKTGHSCLSAVLDVARATQPKRLFLSHVDPTSEADDPVGLTALHSRFPTAEIAFDGQEIEF